MSSVHRNLNITWVKQGTIEWQDWWVRRFGKKLKRIPGQKEHINFANFDLRRNDCPTIVAENDTLEIQDVPDDKLEAVKEILEYHGFKVNSVS